jgi:hypothetical protein
MIGCLHQQINGLAGRCLEKAIQIGKLLNDTKEGLGHGHFLDWLKKLPFTDRTARNYMRVFEHRAELKMANVSNLTTAYRLLEAPEARLSDENVEPFILDQRLIPKPGEWIVFGKLTYTFEGPWLEVIPSKHSGYFYANVFDRDPDSVPNAQDFVEGTIKPLSAAGLRSQIDFLLADKPHLSGLLDSENYHVIECNYVWSWNERLFDSREDYIKRHVLAAAQNLEDHYSPRLRACLACLVPIKECDGNDLGIQERTT